MKKLACAAIALIMGVGVATAAVESDIVGYTSITMEAGKWYQIGTPFVALDETATPKLNDVFNTGFGAGDVLNVFDTESSTYVAYYWNASKGGWARSTAPVASLVDVEIPVGQAVFINKVTAGEVTLSGRVSVGEAVEFGSVNGEAWDQICCVYPQDMKLNEIVWTGLEGGDVINIFSATEDKYNAYYWNASKGGWARSTAPVASLVDVEIPAGQAFFINKISAGKATCAAPAPVVTE